jgi:hypothetical protein
MTELWWLAFNCNLEEWNSCLWKLIEACGSQRKCVQLVVCWKSSLLQWKVLVAVWGYLKCILPNLCLNSGQVNPHLLWCYIAQVHYVLVANWAVQVCIQLLSPGTFFWSKPRSGKLWLIFLYWFSLKTLTYCDLIPQIKPMVKPTRIIIGLHNIQYRWHDLVSRSMYSYLLWLH